MIINTGNKINVLFISEYVFFFFFEMYSLPENKNIYYLFYSSNLSKRKGANAIYFGNMSC